MDQLAKGGSGGAVGPHEAIDEAVEVDTAPGEVDGFGAQLGGVREPEQRFVAALISAQEQLGAQRPVAADVEGEAQDAGGQLANAAPVVAKAVERVEDEEEAATVSTQGCIGAAQASLDLLDVLGDPREAVLHRVG